MDEKVVGEPDSEFSRETHVGLFESWIMLRKGKAHASIGIGIRRDSLYCRPMITDKFHNLKLITRE